MPGRTGLDLLKEVVGAYPETPVMMVTVAANMETAIKALKMGALEANDTGKTGETERQSLSW